MMHGQRNIKLNRSKYLLASRLWYTETCEHISHTEHTHMNTHGR